MLKGTQAKLSDQQCQGIKEEPEYSKALCTFHLLITARPAVKHLGQREIRPQLPLLEPPDRLIVVARMIVPCIHIIHYTPRGRQRRY